MSTRLLAVIAAVALLAVSCGLLNPGTSRSLDPLIRSADGTLYAPACLKALGDARKGECAVDTASGATRSAHRSATDWLQPYYDYFQQNGYYSYVDPYFYSPDTFCGRWGWSPSCFDWFGYGGWQFPSNGFCDRCYYPQELPNASQPASTTGPGASACPSYCSSWWYPTWPTQPAEDVCQGLSGSYTGVCWTSDASSFATQINLTVAATNGTCQVTSAGYSAARVTVRGGVGSAALVGSGVVGGSAAFADFYGGSTFNVSGYDAGANRWFRCSSANAYQPWFY